MRDEKSRSRCYAPFPPRSMVPHLVEGCAPTPAEMKQAGRERVSASSRLTDFAFGFVLRSAQFSSISRHME